MMNVNSSSAALLTNNEDIVESSPHSIQIIANETAASKNYETDNCEVIITEKDADCCLEKIEEYDTQQKGQPDSNLENSKSGFLNVPVESTDNENICSTRDVDRLGKPLKMFSFENDKTLDGLQVSSEVESKGKSEQKSGDIVNSSATVASIIKNRDDDGVRDKDYNIQQSPECNFDERKHQSCYHEEMPPTKEDNYEKKQSLSDFKTGSDERYSPPPKKFHKTYDRIPAQLRSRGMRVCASLRRRLGLAKELAF